MKVSQLKGKIRQVDVVVPGNKAEGEEDEVIWVKFRPGALDLDSLERFDRQTSDLASIRNLLEPMLVDWDLEDEVLDEEGNPTGEMRRLKTHGSDLGKVPLDFLTQVIDVVTDAIRPNPQMGVPSADGSPQTANSGNLQNGMDSSKQPATFA